MYKKQTYILILFFFTCSIVNAQNEHKVYYESGELERVYKRVYKNGYEIFETISYYRNGKIKDNGEIKKRFALFAPNNLAYDKHGYWRFYDENTVLRQAGYFLDDVQTGLWKMYYENGKLQQSGEFIGGKQSGEWKVFYINEKLSSTIIFEDGKLMNLTELYDMNGNSMDISTLKNGNGFLKHYNTDGKLFQLTVKDGVIVQDEPVD